MPRKPRIDAPGLLYHVIARGIDKTKIYRDEKDKIEFLTRLGEVLSDNKTAIYAFALIPNHFHLLVRRIDTPLATIMRRLLTGYAIYFNKRHHRSGHLFQNRYKAIICQDDPYLQELIRYIHLNPIRAGLTETLKELEKHPFSGHGHLLGYLKNDWFKRADILSYFGSSERKAVNAYYQFMMDGLHMGRRDDLTGGGLKRSLGFPKHYPNTKTAYDDRVLGEGSFVEALIAEENKPLIKDDGREVQKLFELTFSRYNVTKQELLGKAKLKRIAEARAFLVCRLIRDIGFSASNAARELSLSKSAVSRIINRNN